MSKTIFQLKLSEKSIERSVRRTFGFCPASKVFKDKKKYDRRRDKRAYEKV